MDKMSAIVDLTTKKITGCEIGSKSYNHELGHLAFSESELGSNIQYWFQTLELYLLGSLSLSFFVKWFKYISVLIFIILISLLIYEEYWCNSYSAEKFSKNETS